MFLFIFYNILPVNTIHKYTPTVNIHCENIKKEKSNDIWILLWIYVKRYDAGL